MDEKPRRSLPHRMLGALRRQVKTARTAHYRLPPDLRPPHQSRPSGGRVLRLRTSAQALREALDGDAARFSIHGALERRLDVQLMHQQVKSMAPRSTAVNKEHRFLLPKFSFEITPSAPSQLEGIQHQDDPPVYSHSQLPSYTSVDVTTSASSHKSLELLAAHPALRPRTSGADETATAKKEARRNPVPPTAEPVDRARQGKLDNHTWAHANGRDPKILVPRHLYLNGSRRGGLEVNPVGSPRR